LVAATKNLFVVPNFVSVTKFIFSVLPHIPQLNRLFHAPDLFYGSFDFFRRQKTTVSVKLLENRFEIRGGKSHLNGSARSLRSPFQISTSVHGYLWRSPLIESFFFLLFFFFYRSLEATPADFTLLLVCNVSLRLKFSSRSIPCQKYLPSSGARKVQHGKKWFCYGNKIRDNRKFLLLQPKILLQQPNVLLTELNILLL